MDSGTGTSYYTEFRRRLQTKPADVYRPYCYHDTQDVCRLLQTSRDSFRRSHGSQDHTTDHRRLQTSSDIFKRLARLAHCSGTFLVAHCSGRLRPCRYSLPLLGFRGFHCFHWPITGLLISWYWEHARLVLRPQVSSQLHCVRRLRCNLS